MEDKINRILNNQVAMGISLAVIQEQIKAKEKRMSKNEKDIEGLKKFKWGIIGTAGVSIVTFLKTVFT